MFQKRREGLLASEPFIQAFLTQEGDGRALLRVEIDYKNSFLEDRGEKVGQEDRDRTLS